VGYLCHRELLLPAPDAGATLGVSRNPGGGLLQIDVLFRRPVGLGAGRSPLRPGGLRATTRRSPPRRKEHRHENARIRSAGARPSRLGSRCCLPRPASACPLCCQAFAGDQPWSPDVRARAAIARPPSSTKRRRTKPLTNVEIFCRARFNRARAFSGPQSCNRRRVLER
jgi:hypothetical protein